MPGPAPDRRGREQEAGDAGAEAGDDVGEKHRAAHGNAGIIGRAARAADSGNMPAEPRTAQENVGEESKHTGDQDRHRQAAKRTGADIVELVIEDRRHLQLLAPDNDQDVVERSAHDQRDQRRQEGAQSQIADQYAIEGATEPASGNRQDEGKRGRQFPQIDADHRHEYRQRIDRTDGQVDAATQHDDGEANDHNQKFAELARCVEQAGGGKEAIDRRAEDGNHGGEQQEGHEVVDPALGEDFADEVGGDRVVEKARQALG